MFWASTPRQIHHHFAAARRRDRKAHNDRMEQAYIAATIPLMKKVPKLQKLIVSLDDPKPKFRQSADEMISIARQWTAAIKRK